MLPTVSLRVAECTRILKATRTTGTRRTKGRPGTQLSFRRRDAHAGQRRPEMNGRRGNPRRTARFSVVSAFPAREHGDGAPPKVASRLDESRGAPPRRKRSRKSRFLKPGNGRARNATGRVRTRVLPPIIASFSSPLAPRAPREQWPVVSAVFRRTPDCSGTPGGEYRDNSFATTGEFNRSLKNVGLE